MTVALKTRSVSTRRASTRTAKTAATLPLFHPPYVELTICELKQRPSPVQEDKKASFSYSAELRDVSHVGMSEGNGPANVTVAYCDFTAGKQIEHETTAEVTATYLFAFKHPESGPGTVWPLEQLTEFVVSISVWPRFRDLVAHMMAQGSTVFPPLPLRPDNIAHARLTSKKAAVEKD